MSKLNYRYQSKDEIPEGAVNFYTEKDGEFVLNISGAKPQADFKAVEDSLKKERRIRKQFESVANDLGVEVDENGDYDLDDIKKAVNVYQNRRNEDGEETIDGETREQIEERVRSKMMKEIEKKDERIQALDGDLKNLLIEDGLKEALLEAGVKNPAYLKAAKVLLRDEVEIDDVDGSKSAVGGVLKKPLKEFVKEWAEGEDGKAFVSAPRNSGGGSDAGGDGGGSGQANPFKKETFNLGEISKVIKDDLNKAKTLAAEAGVDINRYYSED